MTAQNIIPMTMLNNDWDRFWLAYPRRVAKADAAKAWLKAIKLASPETIIAAVENQKQNCAQWHKENGQFIPYPASWLNGMRWEDSMEIDFPPEMIQAIAKAVVPHAVINFKVKRMEAINARIKTIKDGLSGLNSHTPEEIVELKSLRSELAKLSSETGLA